MARAHRIGLVTILVAAVYLLATFNVVPLPFLGEEVRRQILPLVRVLFSRFLWPKCLHVSHRFHGGSSSLLGRILYGPSVGVS